MFHTQRIYWELGQSQSHIRLLHGNLQHHNVPLDAQRGWLAIDAEGVLGELAFKINSTLTVSSMLGHVCTCVVLPHSGQQRRANSRDCAQKSQGTDYCAF